MIDNVYEISLWENVVVEEYVDEFNDIIKPHFEERKIAIIGSNTMTTTCRAVEPNLVRSTNGVVTFTFKMPYTYRDFSPSEIRETFEDNSGNYFLDSEGKILIWENNQNFQYDPIPNPFLNLLTNERKVKVKWDDEWYDLIIKNCQEDSEQKFFTYTCSSASIEELSKTGFNLQFSPDLQNNIGTAQELVEKVLEGTNWKLDAENSDTIRERQEVEGVYTTTFETITVLNKTKNYYEVILSGSKIFIPYLQIMNFANDFQPGQSVSIIKSLQFFYSPNFSMVDIDSSIPIEADEYSLFSELSYDENSQSYIFTDVSGGADFCSLPLNFFNDQGFVSFYKNSQKTAFDPLTQKYCNVYTAKKNGTGQFEELFSKNDVIYGYTETQYEDLDIVHNLLVNTKNFTTTEGWTGDDLRFILWPIYDGGDITEYEGKSYLRWHKTQYIYNKGLRQLTNYIPDGFTVGDKYCFRFKAKTSSTDTPPHPGNNYIADGDNIMPCVRHFKYSGGRTVLDENSPNYFSAQYSGYNNGWVEYEMTCIKSASKNNIYNDKLGFFINVTRNMWVEDVEFFVKKYADGELITPGQVSTASVVTTKYVYYNHTLSQTLTDINGLRKIWNGTSEMSKKDEYLNAVMTQEKIRSLEAENSNRFDLLQKIAELFECQIEFVVDHEENGTPEYWDWEGMDDGWIVRPSRYIRIKSLNTSKLGFGFSYGIDLKSIRRTLQSDQITTKMIVPGTANDCATAGFCTIERSTLNFPRVNFILNFNYYISQGLIDKTEVSRDLYSINENDFRYYYRLHQLNLSYDEITEIISQKRKDLIKQQSYLTFYNTAVSAAEEQIQNYQNELIRIAEATDWDGAQAYIQANIESEPIYSRMLAISTLQQNLNSYVNLLEDLENSVNELIELISEKEQEQNNYREQINELHTNFYRKYYSFIRESVWTGQDYIDDDLYYLDALKNSRISAFPQVSYDISVLDLSVYESWSDKTTERDENNMIQPFKNKKFNLGDITFVEDPIFFGYEINSEGIKTPRKEEVQITEISYYFDEPEKNTIKVQNYKTHFADLFQRITNTVNNFQYRAITRMRK